MPVPWLQIASVGLPLLQKLGESRDVGRYKQQLEQQQKTANLINALSKGRIQYQPTAEYKPSTLTRATGAASTGLGAYQAFKGLQNQQAATDRAAKLDELRLLDAQRTGAAQEGLADYYSRDRPKIGEWTPPPREQYGQPPQAAPKIGQFTPPPRAAAAPPPTGGQVGGGLGVGQAPPSGGPQLRGGLDVGALPQFEAPGLVSSLANLDKYRAMGAEQGRIAESKRLSDLQGDEYERETRRMAAKAAKVRAEAAGAPTATSIRAQKKDAFDKVSGIMKSRGSRGLSFDEAIDGLDLADITSAHRAALQEIHTQALYDRSKNINSKVADFLYSNVRQKFSQDPFLKKVGDLKFGINLLTQGFDLQDGVGDIMMVNASVRLADPGVSVRPAEAETMEEAMALLERYELLATGEKVLEGDRFTPAFRSRLLRGGLANYKGSQSLVAKQLEKESAAILPQVMSIIDAEPGVTGKEAATRIITPFLETYQLFPVETYKYDVELYESGLSTAAKITPDEALWEATKNYINSLVEKER